MGLRFAHGVQFEGKNCLKKHRNFWSFDELMDSLDDSGWKNVRGGYGILYDPTGALKNLELGQNEQDAWHELWNELHHQGDVGDASYAAVPYLVQIAKERRNLGWNFFALVSTIEIERHRKTNPPVPSWLQESYAQAWRDIVPLALDAVRETVDPLIVRCGLATLAIAKGDFKLGVFILDIDEEERESP